MDASGNAYIGGQTWSNDFPLLNPIQNTFGSNVDVFATVLGPSGSSPVFSTYLGGSGRDRGGSVALVSNGVFYVAGVTESTDFPVLPGALQTSFVGNSAAFLSKIDLSATATPDYLLLPAPNSTSVTPGGTAKFHVNVMPLGGFNQTVNISCTGAASKSHVQLLVTAGIAELPAFVRRRRGRWKWRRRWRGRGDSRDSRRDLHAHHYG